MARSEPDLYYALDQIEPRRLDGVFFRHTAPQRDALSGEGARLIGGRWNPVGVGCLYLARPLEACLAEFRRMANGQGRGPESFLPRSLHTVAATGLRVLDLTEPRNLHAVGLNSSAIAGVREPCQRVGEVAHTLGLGGVLAPSATDIGEVLAVFERHAHHDELSLIRSQPMYEVEGP